MQEHPAALVERAAAAASQDRQSITRVAAEAVTATMRQAHGSPAALGELAVVERVADRQEPQQPESPIVAVVAVVDAQWRISRH